jgi:hypothetical protein
MATRSGTGKSYLVNDKSKAQVSSSASRGRRTGRGGRWTSKPRATTVRWILGTLCALVGITIVHRLFVLWLHDDTPRLAPNPYFSTGDPAQHNEDTIARLSRCKDLGLLRNTASPHLEPLSPEEEARRHTLGCGTNQTTLIILSSLWFTEAFTGSTAGEDIYAQSTISTLNYWGYAYVFTSQGWWNHGMARTSEILQGWQNITRTILADPEQVEECWRDSAAGGCLQSEENPDGIPGWKMLSFWYWDE